MRLASRSKRRFTIGALSALGLLTYAVYTYARPLWVPVYRQLEGQRTVQDVVDRYGPAAEARLKPFFTDAKAPYPPSRITLLAIKDEKKLELWTEEESEKFFIRAYKIQAASGVGGPKLREGDRQVPEGIYQLEYLNPNSLYHLSMKINYPNAFDRAVAAKENRTQLGGDIFIHGKAVSIGCLAMGDSAIEELFTLVVKSGLKNVNVIIAPSDPRKHTITALTPDQPEWVSELYQNISEAMSAYRLLPTNSTADTGEALLGKCH